MLIRIGTSVISWNISIYILFRAMTKLWVQNVIKLEIIMMAFPHYAQEADKDFCLVAGKAMLPKFISVECHVYTKHGIFYMHQIKFLQNM